MKKVFFSLVILTSMFLQVKAGGVVSNTNQSASYYRMLARGASTSGDAVYYNPAGLAFLEQGLTVSLNTQMIWMKRTINNDLGTLNNNEFIGNLYVPVFPGVYAALKTGAWTFSLGFNPPAGGGSIEFDKGIPMLENDVSLIPGMMTGLGITTTQYSMESMMKGSAITYGVQAGVTYKVNDMIGIFGGVRMMFADNNYQGHIKNIKVNPTVTGLLDGEMLDSEGLITKGDEINAMADALEPLLGVPEIYAQYMQLKTLVGGLNQVASGIGNRELDVTQKGSGIAPIIGVHFNFGNLNVAAKYEFRTKMEIENNTKRDDTGMYPHEKKLRSDVPALLSLAGSYNVVPALRLSFGYVHHFEPYAKLESWSPDATNLEGGIFVQRQKLLEGGTNEYLAGLEWKIIDRLTLSTGFQWSRVGVEDGWHNDITHNLSNFTLGIGAAFQLNERMTINIGGINTWYEPISVNGQGTPIHRDFKQTYDRTNKAIALGIDYRF